MLYKNLFIKTAVGSNNIGNNLSSTYYDKIKKLRPYNDINNGEKWSQVIELTIDALNETRDVNIVIWFIEANVYRDKLEGLETLQILYDLLYTYPNCYPENIDIKNGNLNYLKENILSWLQNEEILPGIYFKEIFNDLFKEPKKELLVSLRENKPNVEVFIATKTNTISYLQNILNGFDLSKVESLSPTVKTVTSFLNTLQIFYSKIIQYLNMEIEEDVNEKTTITIDQIYDDLNKLVLQGMELDKQDILLYLMKKILLLHNRGCVEIYAILKEDSIAKIINL